jgi:hypothetical protein
MSFNYDFLNATCELIEGIEGHHYKLALSGLFQHYERLGIGHILSFEYNNLALIHNKTHFFNFRIINSLGFESIISTEAPQFFHHIVIMGKFFLPTKCRLEPLYL